MTQAPVGGGAPNAMTLDDVYEAAKAAEPPFQRTMRGIAKGAGLDPDERVLFEDEPLPVDRHHTPIQYFKRLLFAPPKGRARCDEKIETEYGGEARRLVDVVRCSIVVDTEGQLISVAEALARGGDGSVALDGGAIRTAGGDVYEVVRLKNRFKEPLFNGYRDALYSVRVQIAPGVWHVCEMQLHLAAVIAHKEHTHVYYEFFRSHFGGNMSAADDKMKQLLEIGESGATTLEELQDACFARLPPSESSAPLLLATDPSSSLVLSTTTSSCPPTAPCRSPLASRCSCSRWSARRSTVRTCPCSCRPAPGRRPCDVYGASTRTSSTPWRMGTFILIQLGNSFI